MFSMAALSFIVLAWLQTGISSAYTCPWTECTAPVTERFEGNPAAYCAKLEINSVPVKVKVEFKNESFADVWGSVYGFDMYCLGAKFAMCSSGAMNMDPYENKADNCLRRQFEGVDEKLNMLHVKYSKEEDEVILCAETIKTVPMTKERCNHDDMKFEVMDMDMDDMRRLQVVKARKALPNAMQFV